MIDVMLDFETLGTGPDAAVIQIGACYFDRETGEIGNTLKINIDPKTTTGKIDADTVMWWLRQSQEAQSSVAEPGITEFEGFEILNIFLNTAVRIWSHATFDFVILSETLKRLKLKPAFRYHAARDIRTLIDLSHFNRDTIANFPRSGVHHDALDDCKHQVAYCVAAMQTLWESK